MKKEFTPAELELFQFEKGADVIVTSLIGSGEGMTEE